MVVEMGSRRNIAAVVLLLVVGGLLWQFLSGPSESTGDESTPVGLTREVPTQNVGVEEPSTRQLPQQDIQRESAAPDPVEEGSAPEPTKAVVVSRGIFGRVTRKGGEPVTGRKVEVSFKGAMGGSVFGSATTDVDGNYALSIPLGGFARQVLNSRTDVYEEWAEWALEVLEANDELALQALVNARRTVNSSTWLEVSVEDANGFRAMKPVDLRPKMPEQIRVNLLLEERRDLEGQVLGPKGPVPAANIMLFDGEWNLHGTVLSDAEGKFRMNGPPPGPYFLHARLVGVGAGQTGGNFIGGAMRAPFQTIQLGGVMKLSGEVVNPDGVAVRGLPITAIIDSLAQESENPMWPTPSELAQAEYLGALCFSETLTRAKGAFGFTAMEAGNYSLRFGDVAEKYQPQGLFSTSVSNRIIFSACLLEVFLEGSIDDVIDTRVHCVEMSGESDTPGHKRKHFVQKAGFGRVRFILEPGHLWEIYAERDRKMQARTFEKIGDRDYLTKVTMQIDTWKTRGQRRWAPDPPVSKSAELKVKVSGEKGKSYSGRATLRRVESSGDRLVFERRLISKEGFTGLDPGQYRLSIEAGAEGRPFLPATYRGLLSLGAGRKRDVTMKVDPGGGLQLEVSKRGSSKVTGVTAHLVPKEKGLPPVPLSFVLKENAPVVPILPLGDKALCTPIVPAGSYTLVLRATGAKVSIPDQTIAIEVGEILPISIEIP